MFGKAYNKWYATLLYILIVIGLFGLQNVKTKSTVIKLKIEFPAALLLVCFLPNNGMEVSKHSFYYVKA